jgi:hypothetical protein
MQLVGMGSIRPIGRIGPMRHIPTTSERGVPNTEERIPTGFRSN